MLLALLVAVAFLNGWSTDLMILGLIGSIDQLYFDRIISWSFGSIILVKKED